LETNPATGPELPAENRILDGGRKAEREDGGPAQILFDKLIQVTEELASLKETKSSLRQTGRQHRNKSVGSAAAAPAVCFVFPLTT